MSDKKLDLILSELQSLREETNKRFDRIETKIDATFEQVGKNTEAINQLLHLKTDVTTHEHHFNIIDRQLVTHAIEIEKLKNR